MSLGLQPTGSLEFLVRGFGVFAQLCRSWSSQLPNVYVSALAVTFGCQVEGFFSHGFLC